MAKDREFRGVSGRRPGSCKKCGCFNCGRGCKNDTRPPKIQIEIPEQTVTPPSTPPGPDYEDWECSAATIAGCTLSLGAPDGETTGAEMEAAGMPETHRPGADDKACMWTIGEGCGSVTCSAENSGYGDCAWGSFSDCSWVYTEPCEDFPEVLTAEKTWCEASCYVNYCSDGCECGCGADPSYCYLSRGLREEGDVKYYWGLCTDGVSTSGDEGEPMLEPPHGAMDPCPSYTDPPSFPCDYETGWGCYDTCWSSCTPAGMSASGVFGDCGVVYLYRNPTTGESTFSAKYCDTCWAAALSTVYPSPIVWLGKVTFDGNCNDFSVTLPWTRVEPEGTDPELECPLDGPPSVTISNMPP